MLNHSEWPRVFQTISWCIGPNRKNFPDPSIASRVGTSVAKPLCVKLIGAKVKRQATTHELIPSSALALATIG